VKKKRKKEARSVRAERNRQRVAEGKVSKYASKKGLRPNPTSPFKIVEVVETVVES